jgi:hypothetical protein
LIEFDALVRAGEIPILFGPDAERLLETYSACVTGRSLWRTAIDPASIGLDDLWRQAATGAPTGFALAWETALRGPQTGVLAVLDDLDTAALGRWLPRLASLLRSGERPPNLLAVATLAAIPTEGRGPPFMLLTQGFPFEVEASDGAVAAVVIGEATGAAPLPLSRLTTPFYSAVSEEQVAGLLSGLLQPGISPTAARRAARVFRAACATMSPEKAVEFAIEVAKLTSATVAPSDPSTSNARSFAALAARTVGEWAT